MFDEHRHFLHKNHNYKIVKKYLFNGKEETTSNPQRMTPHMSKLEYNRMNHQGNGIPSDVGFCMKFKFGYCLLFTNDIIDVHEGCQGIDEKLPKGLKNYPIQSSRLMYYEYLPIMHLFNAMHIGKNVRETLWKILDGRHDKEKLVKIFNDIDESNHALKFSIEYIAMETRLI